MKQFSLIVTAGFIVATAAPVMAQQGATLKDSIKKTANFSIPVDARPPKGMCRVWIDGVPAAQQPAATDCPAAVKNRPANGRVIFGDDFADTIRTKTTDRNRFSPEAKGFTGVKPSPQLLPKRPPRV